MGDLGWGGLTPPSGGGRIWEGVTPGGGGRPTQIAIFAFSATRQTAMPIRIVPRFCARGCGRFEKLLYGCQNPSRWEKTHVLAKMDIVHWTSYGGHLTLDILRWTSYGTWTSCVGHCTVDIVRWTSYVGHRSPTQTAAALRLGLGGGTPPSGGGGTASAGGGG